MSIHQRHEQGISQICRTDQTTYNISFLIYFLNKCHALYLIVNSTCHANCTDEYAVFPTVARLRLSFSLGSSRDCLTMHTKHSSHVHVKGPVDKIDYDHCLDGTFFEVYKRPRSLRSTYSDVLGEVGAFRATTCVESAHGSSFEFHNVEFNIRSPMSHRVDPTSRFH